MMNNQQWRANGFKFLPRDCISVLFVNARESPAGAISGRQANSSRIHKDGLGGEGYQDMFANQLCTRSMGIYTRQASGLIKSTGTFDSCRTFNAMLPNIIFFMPVYPWVANTIRSTPFF